MRLETRCLILRPPEKQDFEGWALMEADEYVKANTSSVQDQRETWNQLLSVAGHWKIMGCVAQATDKR